MMNFIESSVKKWICPSDRELTLRAKLDSGWSFRTNSTNSSSTISEAEQEVIAKVLQRASQIQQTEEMRVKSLNEKLENIKKQARGDGKKNCILCNDQPRIFSRFHTCNDCHNVSTDCAVTQFCLLCSIQSLTLKVFTSIIIILLYSHHTGCM